ncbi:MAG: hypothetical protein AAB583_06055, partial [Patescibacteria group bacterium]
VTVSEEGVQGNGHGISVALNGNGCVRAFAFHGNNLVKDVEDTNGVADIVVFDCKTGKLTYVTIYTAPEDGTHIQGNGESRFPTLNANGDIVVFCSNSTNLVHGWLDANGRDSDIFAYNRATSEMQIVSVDSDGRQQNGGSCGPFVSGSMVAFHSAARLVPEDTNADVDIYIRDLTTGSIRLVSVPFDNRLSGNSFEPYINCDGSVMVFNSEKRLIPEDEDDKTDVYLAHIKSKEVELKLIGSGGTIASINCMGDIGVFVSADTLLPEDTNQAVDVYRFRILDTGETKLELASVSSEELQANNSSYFPVMDCSGNRVIFTSFATNLTDGNISGVGDTFVRDMARGKTWRVSLTSGALEADSLSWLSTVSCDGRSAAFESLANLIGERNNVWDVFLVTLPPQGICGDLDDNNLVNKLDTNIILKIVVGKVKATGTQLYLGDLNSDGKVDVLDAVISLRHISGSLPTLDECGTSVF